MSAHRHYSNSPEASKVTARSLELPQCEGLRAFAALTSIVQFLLVSKKVTDFDLTLPVQIGFGLIGFMIAAYLLRDRDLTSACEHYELDGPTATIRGLLGSIPLPQMAAVIAVVLLLPQIFAMESITPPDMNEVPAIIVKLFSNYFAGFQKPGFDGKTLMFFPLLILFLPRRLLSMVLLSVLGSGLVLQFAGLFSGSIRPASMFAAPSAFDLLAAGTLLAVITRQGRIGRSEAQIGTSAVLAGLVLALGLVYVRFQGSSSGTTVTPFSAPIGFGVINFIVEIVATTMVSSLWWRDLGGMMDDTKQRVPAR
jgi:hypothetical protein